MLTSSAKAQPIPATSPGARPPLAGADDPRHAVAGFGNLFHGDHGVGLYAIMALEQLGFGEDVRLNYLAEDYRSLLTCLYEAHAAVVILADTVSGRPGTIHVLDHARLRTLAALDARPASPVRSLAGMLELIGLACALPDKLCVLLVEPDPGHDDRPGSLSAAGRRGVRQAVKEATAFLSAHGGDRPAGRPEDRIYRIPWAGMTF